MSRAAQLEHDRTAIELMARRLDEDPDPNVQAAVTALNSALVHLEYACQTERDAAGSTDTGR